MGSSLRLHRTRDRLQRYLAHGCQRAVFAAPAGSDDMPAASELSVDTAQAQWFDQLFAQAIAAAKTGLVKQTFIIDAAQAIVVDARHGVLQKRVLDQSRAQKIMGGKERAFHPEHSADLLRAIGLMNADGTISAKHAKKYKQVCHLAELARPILEGLARQVSPQADRPLRILDLACGNSYLTFVIAETLRLQGIPAVILGIDRRNDVIERSQARAKSMGLAHLHFEVAAIAAAHSRAHALLGGGVDLLLSLHACDTATDEALDFAIANGIAAILCVPCCQAELARQLEGQPALVPALHAHGLLRRAYADALTDALRVELLQACDYAVTTVEFVDSEHTPKNLMLRAHRRTPLGSSLALPDPQRWRLHDVAHQCAQLGVAPSLLQRLQSRQGSHPLATMQ